MCRETAVGRKSEARGLNRRVKGVRATVNWMEGVGGVALTAKLAPSFPRREPDSPLFFSLLLGHH